MASCDFPDMFTPGDALPALGEASVGTLEDLVDAEYVFVLNEYIDVQAGSLTRLREEYMWIDQVMVTAHDNVLYFPDISRLLYPSDEQEEGLVIRGDLLEQLQMDVPETLEDWEKVLAGFESLGVDTPLALGNEATMESNVFLSSYGVASGFFLNEEGKVSSGATSEGLRAYAENMSRWVEMGLADFVAPTEEQKTAPLEVGVWYATADELERLNRRAGQDTVSGAYRLVGAPDPVKQEGDVIALRERTRWWEPIRTVFLLPQMSSLRWFVHGWTTCFTKRKIWSATPTVSHRRTGRFPTSTMPWTRKDGLTDSCLTSQRKRS